mgnify:CR=1 FL=1
MSYSIENGYEPRSFDDILSDYVGGVNTQFGTSYTTASIVGTDWYKYGYAGIQLAMGVEQRLSEVAAKISDYITYINDSIKLPKSTPDGLMAALQDELGVISSIKPVESEDDAGHLDIACIVDIEAENYAEIKQSIIDKLGKYATTGLVYSGTETGQYTALNGQKFNISYGLPNIKNMWVKITATVSRNTLDFVPIENVVSLKFTENFNKAYRFGNDFEPDAYLCKDDLPWASDISIQYSEDGTTYKSGVYKSPYNDLITLKEVTTEIIDE